jgi:hypothetical protein
MLVPAWMAMVGTDVVLRSAYYAARGELADAAHWSEFLGAAMIVMPGPYLLAALIFAACAAAASVGHVTRISARTLSVVSVALVATGLFLAEHVLWSRVSLGQDLASMMRRGWLSPAISVLALAIGAAILSPPSAQSRLSQRSN